MKSTAGIATKLRVGKISYINAIPFFHGLQRENTEEIQYYENYPTKINLAMRKGQIDMAPVSSLEYLNQQKKYCLLPHWAIGSRDFSGSVLLFSREKIENLDNAVIALSRESLSSAVLLRVLLCFKYKFKNRFVLTKADPAAMLQKYKAGLVIGDSALLYQPKDFIYKYDLSELWWNWTSKPFCFAVWAVRREFAKENAEIVRLFYQRLSENVVRNLTDIETLIKNALKRSFLDPDFPKLFGYLFNLQYALDPEMLEGLQLYYRLAHRLGFSPKASKIEFAEV